MIKTKTTKTPLMMAVAFGPTFDEANTLADKVWQNAMYCLQTVSRREHYTPMEMHLALADMQTSFAESYMSYAMNREFALMKQEVRDGAYHTEILDSVEWQKLFHFNGIPHYETITPDCRRVRDDLQLQGFYNFDYELTRLKERLK